MTTTCVWARLLQPAISVTRVRPKAAFRQARACRCRRNSSAFAAWLGRGCTRERRHTLFNGTSDRDLIVCLGIDRIDRSDIVVARKFTALVALHAEPRNNDPHVRRN